MANHGKFRLPAASDPTTATAPRLGRRAFVTAAAAALALPRAARAQTQGVRFFRIGAGPTGGTLFPAAGWICSAISNPPGSRPCERNGSCGVPGLIALAQSSDGSFANIQSLRAGTTDAALAYADMAHDALEGSGPFKTFGPFANLRAVALLAPESLHIIVQLHSGIRTIAALKGKRVAVPAGVSGTAMLADMVLRQHGIRRGQYTPTPMGPEAAASALAAGSVDAMMYLARPPSGVARQIVEDHGGTLLSLDSAHIDAAVKADPFLRPSEIPSGVYGGRAVVHTLAVAPVLLVKAELAADLVAKMSRALWLAMRAADGAHPLDASTFDADFGNRRGVPLHDAAREFRDALAKIPPDAEKRR